MEIGTEISQKIRSAIKAKLVELGAYVDDELPDYIMVMVANKKTQAQMAADLALFLAHNTEKFTSWLQNLLKKLQNISAEGTEKEKHKEHKEKHHHHKSEKKKKRTHSSEKKSEKVSKEVKTSKPEETKRENTAKKKEDEKVETVQSKEEEEDKPELLVSENTDEFNEEYKEEEKTKKPTKTAAPKVIAGRVVERVPASKPIIERRTGTVKATPRTETSPVRQAAMPRKVTRVEKIATTKESSAESRKRKQPSSTVTTIKKKYTEVVEPEEEYDPYNPAVGSVASVIRVTARRSSVPKSLQANKSLLLKAVSEAEKSVSKPESHVQPQVNLRMSIVNESYQHRENESKKRRENESYSRREGPGTLDTHEKPVAHSATSDEGLVDSDIESESSDSDASQEDESGMVKVFRTVYCAAKLHIPSDTINGLLELQRQNGLDIPVTDLRPATVTQIQESIGGVLDKEMLDELSQSTFYGIIVDESYDISTEKKLGLYLRFVNIEGDAVTRFVGNVEVPVETAHCVTVNILKKVRDLGLDAANMVSLGSDGASVMMDPESGVGVTLQTKWPSLLHLHCLAHRVFLSSSDAAGDFPYMEEVENIICSVYNHFVDSSVKHGRLRELYEVFDQPSLREAVNTRWLSLHGPLLTITRYFYGIVCCLSTDAETKDDDSAKELYEQLTSFRFAAVLHFLCDILDVLKVLCVKLQENDVFFGTVSSVMDTYMGSLECLKMEGGGDHYHSFVDQIMDREEGGGSEESECTCMYKDVKLSEYDKADVEELMIKFVDGVKKNLKQRLDPSGNTRDVLDALCAVFDPSVAKDLSLEEIKDHIELLEEHYGQGDIPIVPSGQLVKEWPRLSTLLEGTYRKYNPRQVCRNILRRHKPDLPGFSKLSEAALCIAVTSAVCERACNIQNEIKTNSNCNLTPHSLELLMKIVLGPDMVSFKSSFVEAVRHWKREKKKRLKALKRAKMVR